MVMVGGVELLVDELYQRQHLSKISKKISDEAETTVWCIKTVECEWKPCFFLVQKCLPTHILQYIAFQDRPARNWSDSRDQITNENANYLTKCFHDL